MSEYLIDDNKSEIKELINFCSNIVIKREDKAEEKETFESSKKAYTLIDAILKTDSIDSYNISEEDLLEPELNTKSMMMGVRLDFRKYKFDTLSRKQLDVLLEFKRFQVYSVFMEYGDANEYYNNIYNEYIKGPDTLIYDTFKEFVEGTRYCFFVDARLAKNYSILYNDGSLNNYQISQFMKSYNFARTYFSRVLYNNAFDENNPMYTNFASLVIVFIAIQYYMDDRLKYSSDVNLMTLYDIKNLFISYGLDYFSDMSMRYQKSILKNINSLLQDKGTSKAITSILNIFGFDNVEIFKYVLTKDYDRDVDGNIIINNPKLEFVKIPYDSTNIQKDILKNSERFDYDTFVTDDKYWQITEEEKQTLLTSEFNYIETKYLSIDSTLNIIKNTLDLSYFYGLLKDMKQNGNLEDVTFFDNQISDNRVNIFDSITGLKVLLLQKLGYVDNIITNNNSISYIYEYNYDKILGSITLRDYSTINPTLSGTLDEETINKYRDSFLSELIEDKVFTKSELIDLFVNNKDMMSQLGDMIINTGDYDTYRELRTLYDLSAKSEVNNDNFIKEVVGGEPVYYSTFSEYFLTVDSSFHEFLYPGQDTTEEVYNQKILLLSNTINRYLNTDAIELIENNNTISLNYVKNYMLRLIDLFRSYTVTVKELTTNYVFDSKLLNAIRIFDEGTPLITLGHPEFNDMYDNTMHENNISSVDINLKELSDMMLAVTTMFPKINLNIIEDWNNETYVEFKNSEEYIKFVEDKLYDIGLFDEDGMTLLEKFDSLTNSITYEQILELKELFPSVIKVLNSSLLGELNDKLGSEQKINILANMMKMSESFKLTTTE